MTTHILVVAHAPLATALAQTARHAFPECAEALRFVDVPATASLEDARTLVRSQLPPGPTLVLVDVAGATPANAVREELLAAPEARALAGVNVAMLWRTLCYRHEALEDLLERAREGAIRAVQTLT